MENLNFIYIKMIDISFIIIITNIIIFLYSSNNINFLYQKEL